MKIRIIQSNPDHLQEPITNLINKVYEVIHFDCDNKDVTIIDEELFGGEIVLNKSEYEIVG